MAYDLLGIWINISGSVIIVFITIFVSIVISLIQIKTKEIGVQNMLEKKYRDYKDRCNDLDISLEDLDEVMMKEGQGFSNFLQHLNNSLVTANDNLRDKDIIASIDIRYYQLLRENQYTSTSNMDNIGEKSLEFFLEFANPEYKKSISNEFNDYNRLNTWSAILESFLNVFVWLIMFSLLLFIIIHYSYIIGIGWQDNFTIMVLLILTQIMFFISMLIAINPRKYLRRLEQSIEEKEINVSSNKKGSIKTLFIGSLLIPVIASIILFLIMKYFISNLNDDNVFHKFNQEQSDRIESSLINLSNNINALRDSVLVIQQELLIKNIMDSESFLNIDSTSGESSNSYIQMDTIKDVVESTDSTK